MAASHRRNSESSAHRPIFEVRSTISRSSSESGDLQRTEFSSSASRRHDLPRKKSVLKRDCNQRLTGNQKRVSFSACADEKRVLDADTVLLHIQHGMEFLKLRPGGRQYQRFYQYDKELGALVWRPSSKKPGKAQRKITSGVSSRSCRGRQYCWRVPLDVICEVRAGKKTTLFREYGSDYSQDCSFSLIIAPNYDTVDLVAKSAEDANIWITGIRLITRTEPSEESLTEDSMRDKWLKSEFCQFDKESTGVLTELEVVQLLKRLKVHIPLKTIKLKLKAAISDSDPLAVTTEDAEDSMVEDVASDSVLNEELFLKFFKSLVTRQEIYFLLIKYSSNGSYLTTDDLLLFLESEQGISSPSKSLALDVINRCEPTEDGRDDEILGIDGFMRYFAEPDCDILDPKHQRVIQDMRKPLSHYFINTSHNTYMLEDNVTNRVGVQGYVRALQQGCRCVQVDTWDGDGGEPVVCHSHTSLSKLPFMDVMETINKHAFDFTDYPLVLSLHNHCCVNQQQQMVEVMKKVFGDKLYTVPDKEDVRALPSPFHLKRKVLIKSKKLSVASVECGEVSAEEDMDEPNGNNLYEPTSNGSSKEDGKHTPLQFKKGSLRIYQKIETSAMKKASLCKELSDLVTVCKSVRCTDLQTALKKQKAVDICTFGETTARHLYDTTPEDVLNYNKKLLAKVSPSARRIDGSNFNPQEFWNYGYQMVAMNFQTVGFPMDLNRGRFLQNGGCGFVLKPSIMREEISYFSPASKTELPGISYATLHVKLVSAFQLPKPKGSTAKGDAMDPFILVEVSGLPVDTKSFRSKTIPHNGFNPLFDETFVFRIMMPEMAMLRFVVLDDEFIGDGFIGQYCAPVDCLQQGYRTVKLTFPDGSSIPSASLLVHINITRSHELASPRLQRFSISKSMKKTTKENVNLKTIGVKVIDDTFKMSIHPLQEATELRESFQKSLNMFKECCGFTAKASVKNCLRVIVRRYSHPGPPPTNEDSPVSLVRMSLSTEDQFPTFRVEGSAPVHLQRSMASFDQLVEQCKLLLDKFADVYERLSHSRRSALEWHESISKLCAKEGLKEKRITKVFENFSWNIRILSGQTELFKAAKTSCKDVMKQVQDSAVSRPIEKRSRRLSDVAFVS